LLKKLQTYGFSGLRKTLFIVLISSLILIILASYFLYKENQPVNYFMNLNNQNYKIFPINSPILQVDRAKQWATAALAIIFSFDFVSFEGDLEISKEYFTDAGWASFQTALQNNGLMDEVVTKNLVFKTNVCSLPVLANREQDPKAFYLASKWKFLIPIIINIQGASGVTRNSVYIVETDIRFLTDEEISKEKSRKRTTSILGIDSIKMKSANFTNYCKIPF